MVSALYLIVDNHGKPTQYLDVVANGRKFFFNPTDAIMVTRTPRIGVGPGFDSQGRG